MKILGAIIAGGASSRMGGKEKAFLCLHGQPLLRHVIDRLAPQVSAILVNANGDPQRFAGLSKTIVPDILTNIGTPLAGLHASLSHAAAYGYDAVLSVPTDTPLIPADLAQRLLAAGCPSIASSAGQDHYLTGLWPVTVLPRLERLISDGGMRRVKDFARETSATRAIWDGHTNDPFANINTPEDFDLAATNYEVPPNQAGRQT